MGITKTESQRIGLSGKLETELTISRGGMIKFMLISLILLTAVSIFHVWSRFRLVELNLQLGESSRQLKELEQEQKRLRLEAESLKTPARIETLAKRDLGMTIPKEHQMIQVR